MVIINKTINKIAIPIIAILLLALSYFIGFQNSKSTKQVDIKSYENQINELKSTITTLTPNAKKLEDIGFKIPSNEGKCIDEYKYKIKLDKGNNKIYKPNDKTYEKVKADICAKSEFQLKQI
jgi:hypothetical protein